MDMVALTISPNASIRTANARGNREEEEPRCGFPRGGPQLATRADPPALTPTQTKVFRLVHAGLPNKEIARALQISEATVKIHMTALMRRLNVRNRTQVAIVASRYDWGRTSQYTGE